VKKSYLKIIILEISSIIILFNSFLLNILNSDTNKIIFWLLIFIILKFIVGLEKDKSITKTDISLEVFIFTFIYIFLEYFLGLATGFVNSPYNLGIIGIIKNILPILILIILEELSRYIILTKGKRNKLIIILSVILFTIFDTVMSFNLYDITSKLGIFEILILILLPSISKNILLTFVSDMAGFRPCILYRSILELIIYVVPIYANLGEYLDSILKIVLPLIFLLKLIITFKKGIKTDIRKKRIISKIILLILIIILSILVSLVSGYFKYQLLVIASGSMEPNISIGDAVLTKKIEDKDLKEIKENDILVYQYDDKIIVHRVVKIFNIDDKYIYQTKGDKNADVDNWLVYGNQIIGIVKTKIKYIGYPSVLLNNYLNK
jgi:signal peptidase I